MNWKHKAFVLMLILLIARVSVAQHWELAKSFTYVSKQTRIKHASDNQGNIYVTGEFGTDTNHLTIAGIDLETQGDLDIFIVKLDKNLSVSWVKSFGNLENESVTGISVDIAGDLLITGYFKDSLNLDNFKLKSKGSFDFFLVKFDSDGNVKWARSGGSVHNDKHDGIIGGIYTDRNRNVYVCGSFDGSEKDTKPTAWFDSLHVTSFGEGDIFVSKYSENGKIIWIKNLGSYSMDAGQIFGSNESIYLFGRSNWRLNYDTVYLHDDFGSRIGFILKMDTSGKVEWANAAYLDDFGTISVSAITADLLGNFYAVGSYFCASNTCRFKFDKYESKGRSQSSTQFIVKLNKFGKAVWVKEIDGYPIKMICKSNNHFIITGRTQGKIIYDGEMHSNLYDYILEIDSLGQLLKIVDCPNSGTDLSLEHDGSIIISGNNWGSQLKFDNIILPQPDKPSSFFIAKRNLGNNLKVKEVGGNWFNFYPNPSDEIIKIQMPEIGLANLSVYRADGKQIFTKELTKDYEEVVTKDWSNGLYIFRIWNGTEILQKRVLITH